jgi:cytochrome c oxidase assembly protein subunit 15
MLSRAAFARLTAGSAFFLLIAGGLVTSTGSGLSVPDWPLSFGKAFPPMVGGVFFEHGHRIAAGLVALLTFSLTFWVWKEEQRAWVKSLAGLAALSIVLQALLGGLTVLLKLPPQVSIAHACLGQAVFCMLLALADASGVLPQGKAPAGLWRLGAAAAAAAYIQLILGALIRHAGAGIGWHLVGAAVVALGLSLLAARTLASTDLPGLRSPSWVLAGLLPLQLGLGLGSYLTRRSLLPMDFRQAAALTTAHLGVGALLLGTCVLLALRAYRMR